MTYPITHIACSDESKWNIGRYRAIALVTTPAEYFQEFDERIRVLLRESSVKEFRWKKLKTARERFAAVKLLDLVLDNSCRGCLRVDVMVWDIEDSRHNIPKRDDTENLQRMYHHLFKNVLRERWPDNSIWILFPDEHSGLDWKSAKDFLGYVNSTTEVVRDIFTGGPFRLRLKQEFHIYDIREATSGEPCIIQLADLFAGLASFSREAYGKYSEWLKAYGPQQSLFTGGSLPPLSNAEIERFRVLHHLDSGCKSKKMGVSLKSYSGLRTLEPKNPLNFWWYEPQSEMDKAPTR